MRNGPAGLSPSPLRRSSRTILTTGVVAWSLCAATVASANTPVAIAHGSKASRECTKIVDAKDVRRIAGETVTAPVVSSDTVVLGSAHS